MNILKNFLSYLFIGFSVFCLCVLSPHQAEAQSKEEKAKVSGLLKEGVKFLDDKEYASALEKFEAAFAIIPSPKILFNVGLANEGLARPAKALRAFNGYLAGASADTAQRRKDASEHIAALKKKVAMISVGADVDGARVLVDGVASGATPLSEPIAVEPGPHQVVVQHTDHKPWTMAIEAVAGKSLALEAKLKETPVAATTARVPALAATGSSGAPNPTIANEPDNASAALTETAPGSETEEPYYKSAWFWGGVGAVVVAGVVTAILLSGGDKTVERPCPNGFECPNLP